MSKAEQRRQQKHQRQMEIQQRKKQEKKAVKEIQQRVTASEIEQRRESYISWRKRNHNPFGFMFMSDDDEVSVPVFDKSDDPDEMFNMARKKIQHQWTKTKRDETKTVGNANQLTRSEMLARLEEKYYGIPNPYAPKEYMYRFVDGEAEVIDGDNWMLAAAHQMEKMFNG